MTFYRASRRHWHPTGRIACIRLLRMYLTGVLEHAAMSAAWALSGSR